MKKTKRDRLSVAERLIIWAVMHIDRIPYILTVYIDKRFNVDAFVKRTDDPLPRRLLFRRVYKPTVNKDGTYRYGVMPLTVGRRFKTMQAIRRDDLAGALSAFYGFPRWYLYAGAFGKINRLLHHMGQDLVAREKRDRRLQTPLTDTQRMAGYDKMDNGLFGIIDYVATRNHLTYPEVEGLSDNTLYAILKIDHDKAEVQRREMEIQAGRARNQRYGRRTSL